MRKVLHSKYFAFAIAVIITIVSSFVLAVGVKVFLSPNQFLSTGATGIALIIGRAYDLLFSPKVSLETTIAGIVLFILNIPLLILSWKKLSHQFTILTAINVIVNSITMTFLPDDLCVRLYLSVANGNISFLDAALFVGLLNGSANAVAYIVGGSTGGIDVLSMYYSLRKQYSIGKLSVAFNAVIILVGMLIVDKEVALSKAFYTLVYLVINSTVIDLFYVRNKRAILLITTSKGKEIADEITHHFVRGVTILDSRGGYTNEHKDFLYCACSSFEVVEITKKVKSIDEHAFISVVEAHKVHGNFINKELR
ncbi:MAG: YitT family protein [Erysipelotrichaceae bacterium]|nr:YitT family protein [Erysipelotrichaceae bacterium]